MESDFGPGGRALGQKLLQGPVTKEDIHAALKLPDYISPQDVENAIGTGSFMQQTIPGLGAAADFLALGQAHLKNFVDVNIPAITAEQQRLGQGDLSMEQIRQYDNLIENADPQTQSYIRDFKDSNGRNPTLEELKAEMERMASRSE